jgi:DNA-binding NarL/FixJ family response regulator
MARDRSITVLVADDDAAALQGLEALFSEAEGIDVVAAATDGREAVRLAVEHEPIVVVMDIGMPGCDGLDATRLIRQQRPEARVIVLSVDESSDQAMQAFRSGAVGFLPKDSAGKYLVEGIRMAAQGEAVMTPSVGSHLVRSMYEGQSDYTLTAREMAVIRLVAEGRTNDQIGRALDTSVSTVKAQLSALFEKLGARDRASAVAVCFRRGVLR